MKLFSLLAMAFFAVALNAQIIDFPDSNFKARLLSADTSNNIARNLSNLPVKIDANLDGEIDDAEAANISYLNVNNSGIASLDGLEHFTNLTAFLCESNQITVLDVSPLHALFILEASFNDSLIWLNIKNGKLTCNIPPPPPQPPGIGGANFESCANLNYLCGDEEEISNAQLYADIYYPAGNVVLNSYCSFSPGGNFYTIQGNARIDLDGNGCDASDSYYPNLKLSYNNGTNTAVATTGNAGHYTIPLMAGDYTITPVFENPEYFNVSPSNVPVAFTVGSDSVVQDFCITPNGTHPDLEIVLLPMGSARPGFDSNYKLIYKNKGNIMQSGTVAFGFNDAVLDFVSASPAYSSRLFNYLYWTFSDLKPMETREVLLTLNANSPVETPPLNSGFILNFTTQITAGEIDDTAADNSFTLYQTVINSFDPNEKICLEGAVITPEMAGKEVHYMIRFENTGTANAQNIVVKDMIDPQKFDIDSLIPLVGSAPFVTKIRGNKVEFIFENINLPFDDANNDGYIAFKIKTQPTLVAGDVLSNTADIYFDYNAPISTNTAITSIGALAKTDFAFENYFRMYPNPADDILNLESKQNIEITSISVYNTLGQLVLVIPSEQKSIDVSGLEAGNYFIKINSDRGTANNKFIKK